MAAPDRRADETEQPSAAPKDKREDCRHQHPPVDLWASPEEEDPEGIHQRPSPERLNLLGKHP
jgi:hypothetical protein